MNALMRRSASILTELTTDLALLVWSDGLQGRARRNAWSSMVEDSKRARARVAVETAMGAVAPAPLVAASG